MDYLVIFKKIKEIFMSFRSVIYNKLTNGKKTVSGSSGSTVSFPETARSASQQRASDPTVFDSSVFIKPTATRAVFILNRQISSNVNNFNLKNELIASGWNQVLPVQVTITIDSTATVGSTSTSSPAFLIESLPEYSEIVLVNNGKIQGAGGNGASITGNPYVFSGSPGGPALSCQYPVFINNASGKIWAGGGGGGTAWRTWIAGGVGGNMGIPRYTYAAGGGGGSGFNFGSRGTAVGGRDALNADTSLYNVSGVSGSSEVGGNGGNCVISGTTYVTGGAGGGPGLPGQSGVNGGGSYTGFSSGTGGAAGNYIVGNSYVTWVSVGDCRGNVS